MNRLNERYSDLIYYLFNKNNWCSLDELSLKTGFSRSTIWRDLTFMTAGFPREWKLEKNDTLGVRLNKPPNGTLESLWIYMKEKNPYFQTLEMIILQNGVTVSDVVNRNHISRSTVYRQLEKIEEVLKSNGIALSSSPYRLQGDERKIRRFIMQYMEVKGLDIHTEIDNYDTEEFLASLLKLTTKNSISLHIGAIQRLTTIMYIANLRASYGCYVNFPEEVLETYQTTDFFEISKRIFPFMYKCPSRYIQLQEILFFAMYLTNEEKPINRKDDLRQIRLNLRSNNDYSSKLFLEQLSNNLNYDIINDDEFLFKYVQTMRRISFDTQFDTDTRVNQLLSFLPYLEKNPLFIEIEELASQYLECEHFILEKLDIIEIFLLVQSSLLRKRNETTFSAALICRTYVENDYITQVLKYHFSSQLQIIAFDITDLESLQKFNEFDILITTFGHLSLKHIPVFNLSCIPSAAELNEISYFINQYFLNDIRLDDEKLYPFTNQFIVCH